MPPFHRLPTTSNLFALFFFNTIENFFFTDPSKPTSPSHSSCTQFNSLTPIQSPIHLVLKLQQHRSTVVCAGRNQSTSSAAGEKGFL
ncbi:hypothetical protein P8452_07640 [Trifolium repens]|nr:hypothetical protein P8452_07640 [Trifolium repens]